MEKPNKAGTLRYVEAETTRYGNLPSYAKVIFLFLTAAALVLSVIHVFGMRPGGLVLYIVSYYYLFASFFLFCAFLILPARKKDKDVPWYDFLAAALAFGIGIYFFTNAWEIGQIGWRIPSTFNTALGLIYQILILELCRRMVGPVYLGVCIIFGIYPLFAGHMPGMLFGIEYGFLELAGRNVFGFEGLLGLPSRVMASILMGFLLFAAVLMASGAGSFFLSLALAILGRFRGGPAKVAVLASGFFGSLSGSIFANIAATGSFTIPAMKRLGYPPRYAGAIEACASAGGGLMPPVMGSVAFIMAAFLGVDYSVIIIVAAIPAILYYFGLLMQVDAYAARVGLKGLPREELPSLTKTLKQGWPFIAVLVFLVWGLVYMKWAMLAPYYATGLMFLLSFTSRETMLTPKRIIGVITTLGKLVTQSMAVIFPLIFILAGLVGTGLSASFTGSLVALGGENIFLILILGVIACYIMGMAGMLQPAYIFLAATMAPAVIKLAGLNELAVHLFIIYYTILAGITPPVAPGAFLAGTMAGANLMKTAVQSMRLAIVIYFIPFFFIFNPSLVLQGPILEAAYLFALCLLGIVFIAAGMEGHLVKVGRVGLVARPLLVVAGLLIGFPEWNTTFIGAALAVFVVAVILIRRKPAAEIGV